MNSKFPAGLLARFFMGSAFLLFLLISHGCRPKSGNDSLPAGCATVEQVLSKHPEYLAKKKPGPPPNIIILLVDALRPDHLSCYNYHRPTSPFIDRLASEGTRFTNAFVHSTHTMPSTACLFTGAVPPLNGLRSYGKILDESGKLVSDRLSPQVATLAELLRGAGYRTAGFIANGLLREDLGFKRGFDVYQTSKGGRAEKLNADALAWLESPDAGPFFCYMHYWDVHSPYRPPEPYSSRYGPQEGELVIDNGIPKEPVSEQDLLFNIGQYDGTINFIDDELSKFWGMLEERALLDNTLVVILADHGEEFMEHGGFGHGTSLYDEVVHIPLIFWYPGVIPPGVVRNEMVSHSDIFPTLASFAGAPVKGLTLSGFDLFSVGSPSRDSEKRRLHYSDLIVYKPKEDLKSIRTCTGKLIVTAEGDGLVRREYYDLLSDPGERNDIYSKWSLRIRRLDSELEEASSMKTPINGGSVTLDEEAVKELRALGYIE